MGRAGASRGIVEILVAVAIAAGATASAAEVELLSGEYLFKRDVVMRVGLVSPRGARLETVRFGTLRLARAEVDRLAAQVVVRNSTGETFEAGVALALHDGAGRLVGAAHAGPALVRAGRPKSFDLVFDGTARAAGDAETFQISVELP